MSPFRKKNRPSAGPSNASDLSVGNAGMGMLTIYDARRRFLVGARRLSAEGSA